MYCPNCGQQQISDEMRFCSRCGQALSGLAEWLAGGAVPATRKAKRKKEKAQLPASSRRRKGIRRAAKLMFISGVLFPIFLVISLIADEGGPMVVPFMIFFVSLVLMLYARLFMDNTPYLNTEQAQPSGLGSMRSQGSLPPASNLSMPGAANLGRQQVRTNELAQQPPSVTEHTTRLLEDE
jgi:ABC-type transport system involved in cytochrome bd biosynthesis fused ATPase/permease subunit